MIDGLGKTGEGPKCRALANGLFLVCFFEIQKTVPRWVSFLFVMLVEYFSARRCAQIKFVKLQVDLLKKKIPGDRVILLPEDRAVLLKAGAILEHDVHDVLGIVSVKTYKQWCRDQEAGKDVKKVRLQRIAQSIQKIIVRLNSG